MFRAFQTEAGNPTMLSPGSTELPSPFYSILEGQSPSNTSEWGTSFLFCWRWLCRAASDSSYAVEPGGQGLNKVLSHLSQICPPRKARALPKEISEHRAEKSRNRTLKSPRSRGCPPTLPYLELFQEN